MATLANWFDHLDKLFSKLRRRVQTLCLPICYETTVVALLLKTNPCERCVKFVNMSPKKQGMVRYKRAQWVLVWHAQFLFWLIEKYSVKNKLLNLLHNQFIWLLFSKQHNRNAQNIELVMVIGNVRLW